MRFTARTGWAAPGLSPRATLVVTSALDGGPGTLRDTVAADASSPFLRPDRLGDPSTNYYYRGEIICDLSFGSSNRVGEFDFALTPG